MSPGGADVVIVGAGGRLGVALTAAGWPEGWRVAGLDRAALDVIDAAAVARVIAATAPAVIINAAAWTDVDGAETDPERALAVNARGAAHVAEAARAAGAALIHVSTDYVFDGAEGAPYAETDAPRPRGVYGAGKLEGETAVRRLQPRSAVVRTAWLFGPTGRDFVGRILDAADRDDPLEVVDDQRGSPTATTDLAQALAVMAVRMANDRDAPTGLYHFAGAGEATWRDVAVEILKVREALTGRAAPTVGRGRLADRPGAAIRPRDTRLDCAALARDYGVIPRPWRDMVADVVAARIGEAARDGGGRR